MLNATLRKKISIKCILKMKKILLPSSISLVPWCGSLVFVWIVDSVVVGVVVVDDWNTEHVSGSLK